MHYSNVNFSNWYNFSTFCKSINIVSLQLETGYLKHVFAVFDRLGYVVGDGKSDWDVLWSHEYPFESLARQISSMRPHQKVGTVNMVIFAGGKFREDIVKTFHVGVIFTIILLHLYFLHKGIWVLFSHWGNFLEEDNSAKNTKITPTQKFPRLQYSM